MPPIPFSKLHLYKAPPSFILFHINPSSLFLSLQTTPIIKIYCEGERSSTHMDPHQDGKANYSQEDLLELRRGPWTVDEDFTLINYIAHHGEGRWNSLARSAGIYSYNFISFFPNINIYIYNY